MLRISCCWVPVKTLIKKVALLCCGYRVQETFFFEAPYSWPLLTPETGRSDKDASTAAASPVRMRRKRLCSSEGPRIIRRRRRRRRRQRRASASTAGRSGARTSRRTSTWPTRRRIRGSWSAGANDCAAGSVPSSRSSCTARGPPARAAGELRSLQVPNTFRPNLIGLRA